VGWTNQRSPFTQIPAAHWSNRVIGQNQLGDYFTDICHEQFLDRALGIEHKNSGSLRVKFLQAYN
jgi:hypothetical protein